MPRTAPFEAHHRRYDDWFVRHAAAYQSELLAVRALLPWRGLGLAIGVGTGRFAVPLGVQVHRPGPRGVGLCGKQRHLIRAGNRRSSFLFG